MNMEPYPICCFYFIPWKHHQSALQTSITRQAAKKYQQGSAFDLEVPVIDRECGRFSYVCSSNLTCTVNTWLITASIVVVNEASCS